MGLGGGWNNNSVSAQDLSDANAAIDAALESGINFFDHADIYTLGKAETVFGQVLKQRPELKDKIYLQSKCGIRFEDELGPKRYDFSKTWINDSVDGILSRLGLEQIDILLLHRPDPLMEPEEIAEVFETLRLSGKVKHFGVSNMQQHQMAFLQRQIDVPIVANQIEISLKQLAWIDESVMAGNPDGKDVNFTAGTLEYCRQHNIQLQSWGSLCQGLFSGRDVSAEAAHIQQTAALVQQIAEGHETQPEAIVLAWLMRHPTMVQPMIGSTNPARIKASAKACDIQLSREEWYALYVSARGEEMP